MALTLIEASKLSNDTLLPKVFNIRTKKGVLPWLPFVDAKGKALTYNRVNTAPTVGFTDVGDALTPSEPTFTQLTASTKHLVFDGDVNNHHLRHWWEEGQLGMSAVDLFKTVQLQAVLDMYDNTFITGDEGLNPDAFDGLDILVNPGNKVSDAGGNGSSLSIALLEEAIDVVTPDPPDALLMSARSRRSLAALNACILDDYEWIDGSRKRGWVYKAPGTGGRGVPVIVHSDISDAQTVGTSNDCSTIYPVRFGDDGVVGVQAAPPTVEEIGELESKDETRFRARWYAALAVFNTNALAAYTGVRP